VLEAAESIPDAEILDFVTDQTLNRLARPLRRFVLRTSVLTELDAGICAALVPEANPDAMLAELHRQGLAMQQHQVARYHSMIRAAAIRALRAEETGAEGRLLRIAGDYARRQGQDQTAMSCFVGCADWDTGLDILTAAAPGGFADWEPRQLHAALLRLPAGQWTGNAERRTLIAFSAAISGDHLLAAEAIAQAPAAITATASWWPALTHTIRALSLDHRGDALSAQAEIIALDDRVPIPPILGVADRPSLAAMVHLLAARASLFEGDLDATARDLDAGWGIDGAQLPRYCVLAGLGTAALAAAWSGELAAAQRFAVRARRLADQAGLRQHGMIGLTLLARIELLRARGHITQALGELALAAPVLNRGEPFLASLTGGQVHTIAEQILRATLMLDRSDLASARAELTMLTAAGDDDLPASLAAAAAVAWARLHLLSDDVPAAEQALNSAPATGAVRFTRVAAALQRQAPEAAQLMLAGWPALGSVENRLRRLLAGAAVAHAMEARERAVAPDHLTPEVATAAPARFDTAGDCIDAALDAAEPDGHIQVFLDAPPAARAMTSAILRRSQPTPGWRRELAERLEAVRLPTDAEPVSITRRERVVLEHLARPLTHAQIAASLFVSENTLKSHCRNLYRKLGVNSQADAVRIARAQGWLDPAPRGDVVLDVNISPTPATVQL
jgi:LuxR family maltose regulon positive regulatory protein